MIGGFFPLKNILIPTGIRLKSPGILNIPIDFIGITFSLSLPLLLMESTKPFTCLAPLLFNIPIFSAVVLKDIILSIGFSSVGHLRRLGGSLRWTVVSRYPRQAHLSQATV